MFKAACNVRVYVYGIDSHNKLYTCHLNSEGTRNRNGLYYMIENKESCYCDLLYVLTFCLHM